MCDAMDQMADEMTLRADEKGKERDSIVEQNCIWVRDEEVQSEAQVWTEPGEADTNSQQSRECDSATPPLFTVKKYFRRPSSSSSSSSSFSTESLSSPQQTDMGVDCAGIILKCLFCRFYDMFLMVPDSCERAVYHCCPTYKQFSTTMESAPADTQHSSMNFDCGLLDACQDTSECLELAMELSELCYH